MAETSAKRRGELVRAVFEVLHKHPDGFRGRDIMKEVEQRIGLTDFEKEDFENAPGVRRFEFHLRFATIKAVKAGWLVKKKGEWSLTEEGRSAYADSRIPNNSNGKPGACIGVGRKARTRRMKKTVAVTKKLVLKQRSRKPRKTLGRRSKTT